ncbi:V-type ATP synthase subunit I [Candidatus Woesearchaeota archaeon]|nr:V-type ATP synthase subunit I [Candidatus Woesearchaeota archaeon]
MFRPAKIHHTIVLLREDSVNELITLLYELGICELKKTNVDLPSKYSYELVKNVDEIQTRLNFIIDSLEEYKEIIQPGSRIKELFSPQPLKKQKSILYSAERIIEEVTYHLDLIEPKIRERLDKLQEIKERLENNNFLISNLSLIPDIGTNIFESSDTVKCFLGLINTASVNKIKGPLKDKTVIGVKEKDKNQSLIAIFSFFEDSSSVERALHEVGFQEIEIPFEDKRPMQIINSLKKENDELNKEEMKIGNFLKKIQKIYEKKLVVLEEELNITKQKIVTLENFKATKAFSVVEAWVPEKDLKKFCNSVKKVSTQHYIEIDEKDDAPTLFRNHRLVRPFEMITELYSPPRYKGFDPTPILAITFTLFFGFMLTDAVYGLMVLALGWMMYKGIGKINEAMKRFAIILVAFGISTTIMGVIFGSYFGDFFQKIGIPIPVPIDSMRQVMLTLSIALALGSLHLMIGLVSGFYDNIHQGSFKDAMAKQGVWLIFLIGLFLLLLRLNTPGLVAVGLAILLQMFFNFLEGGAVSSLLSVFGFSGFIGDLFSYARLMALAIGTAGISLAVNFMVFMVIDLIPWIGIPIAMVIFVIGHLFNVLMNGLGAFIHSTRLHFLEFFTKFYEGGGRTYKPFLAERKNTIVKLE